VYQHPHLLTLSKRRVSSVEPLIRSASVKFEKHGFQFDDLVQPSYLVHVQSLIIAVVVLGVAVGVPKTSAWSADIRPLARSSRRCVCWPLLPPETWPIAPVLTVFHNLFVTGLSNIEDLRDQARGLTKFDKRKLRSLGRDVLTILAVLSRLFEGNVAKFVQLTT
jgi:hypothetical protein